MTTWILVADETRGRFFETARLRDAYIERIDLVHPELKLPERDLTSDAHGRNPSAANRASHRLNEAGKVRSQHALKFAKEIVSTLNKAEQQKQFSNLVLVAAPAFLGVLRKELGANLRKRIRLEMDKDLTKLSADQIRQHLPERLPVTHP